MLPLDLLELLDERLLGGLLVRLECFEVLAMCKEMLDIIIMGLSVRHKEYRLLIALEISLVKLQGGLGMSESYLGLRVENFLDNGHKWLEEIDVLIL